jgi:3-hydroxyacyl-[acyl-carrier-protein] dehydratase
MNIRQKPGGKKPQGQDIIFPDIPNILPQKYPFLFIDRVLEVDKIQSTIKCLKNITINEYYFQGHFQDNPVVPGVILIEAMAQAALLLYAVIKPENAAKHPDYYLGKVEANFKKPVTAGDCVIIEIKNEKIIDTGGSVKARAKVNGEIVAEAAILFGVKTKNK